MASLGTTFDPASVQSDDGGFEPLEAGTYDLQVIDSKMKPTASGGERLELICEVITGPKSGRRVWLNLNIRNDNAQAQEIAHRDLKKLCDATGTGPINDSDELHFKPFRADVVIAPPRGNFGPSNNMRNFKAISASTDSAPTARPQASRPIAVPSPAATTASPRPARPWGNSSGAQPRAVENEDQIPF